MVRKVGNGKKKSKLPAVISALVAVAMICGIGLFQPAPVLAQTSTYPGSPSYPSDNRGTKRRNNWGGAAAGAAIGLGIGIILESSRARAREKAIKEQRQPKRVTAPQRSQKPKKPKKQTRRTKKPRKSTKAKVVRVVLPQTMRIARPKPSGNRIGTKPLLSSKSFVVALRPGLPVSEIEAFLKDYDLTRLSQSRIGLLDQVYLKLAYPQSMGPQEALQMAMDKRIYRAQPAFLYYPAQESGSGGGDYGLQYAFRKLNMPPASGDWTGKGISIAVIDSGIAAGHPAVQAAQVEEFSAFEEGQDGLDTDHGTALASIIAAQQGMKGIAHGVNLMSAQVFRRSDEGFVTADSYDIARGIDWAVTNGAQILNLSFAGARDELLESVLAKAAERGIVAIAAAGNEGEGAPAAYPAAYDSVIAVTAIDASDALYNSANRGEHVEIAAPGVDVLVASGEDGFTLETGTSMAAAYISGAVALMLERQPDLTTAQIKERVSSSVRDLGEAGRDPYFGHGVLDMQKALAATPSDLSQ
ncbi:MAG: S8 family serine peptidase [Cohaesibacter sp.]|jgi:subtilisin family serine protease|nr:S8 family serine peptidase [Cohaesibacter sp.]